jgi:hypothetical protein
LRERELALETIAKEITPATMGDAAALQALLEQRPLLQLLFNGGVFITRTDGTAIADVPISTGRIGTNYIDRESVSIPLAQGRTVIGRPAIGKKLGAPIFSIAAPIFDNKAKAAGVIVGTINLGKPSFSASSVKSVGQFRLRKLAKHVVQGELSDSEGAKAVGFSHGHFDLVV